MPLWHVYHPPGTYTREEKQRFASDVTDRYFSLGLPKFYVMTLFHEVDANSFYVGGESRDETVRIVIDHIARSAPDESARKVTRESLAQVVAPYTTERGIYCEFHVDETPRDLWMMDGIAPPALDSDDHQAWLRANRPMPY